MANRRYSPPRDGPAPVGTLAEAEKAKALQTGLFALERAMGAPIAEIAAKYKVSKEEVEVALSSAERLNFVEAYRDLVRDRLVPQALVVYEMHLRQGDLDAAKAILEGVGVLQKPGQASSGTTEEESLLAYRIRRTPPATKEQVAGPDLPVLPDSVQ